MDNVRYRTFWEGDIFFLLSYYNIRKFDKKCIFFEKKLIGKSRTVIVPFYIEADKNGYIPKV